MRKVIKIILGIVSVIAAPIVIDFCVFGNTFPSNIDNQTWAGFLGGYLGGIATLVAVFITISDNNKKMEKVNETTFDTEGDTITLEQKDDGVWKIVYADLQFNNINALYNM